MPSREASRHMIASSVAAAPMLWPSAPLIELTGTAPARAPSTRRSTAVSILSFSGVPVPCALTKSTASPPTPAAASAPRTACSSPRPSGSGAATCEPSLLLAWPSRRPRRPHATLAERALALLDAAERGADDDGDARGIRGQRGAREQVVGGQQQQGGRAAARQAAVPERAQLLDLAPAPHAQVVDAEPLDR